MPQISQSHMREYETVFVLKTDIEDEVAIAFINKMKDLVEKQGGKHLQVTNWGRKKLAWERNRQQKGMFVHHRYLGHPGIVAELERNLGIEEACILRQTVRTSKTVDPETRQPEADLLEPPITKDPPPRRDDRGDRGDRGDRFDRFDRGDRGDRFGGGGGFGGFDRGDRDDDDDND